MKSVKEARIGDTFFKEGYEIEPELGFEKAKPIVISGLFPEDPVEFYELHKAIEKLTLKDPAVQVE